MRLASSDKIAVHRQLVFTVLGENIFRGELSWIVPRAAAEEFIEAVRRVGRREHYTERGIVGQRSTCSIVLYKWLGGRQRKVAEILGAIRASGKPTD